MLLSVASLLLCFLTFVRQIQARATKGNPLFIGCVSDQFYPNDSYDVGSFDDPISCAQFCFDSTLHTTYSTWTLVPDDSNRCYCHNTFPSPNEIQVGIDSNGNCDSSTQSYIFITSSTFGLVGCKSTQSSSFQVIVTSPEICIKSCKDSNYSMLSPQLDGFHCTCGEIEDVGPQSVDCGIGTWITYKHISGQYVNGPSGFVKRQKFNQKRLDQQNNQFCPIGLKACKLPNNDEAYECLNINTELESCGGCLYGDYGRSDTPTGVDCTSLPGVPLGATTCTVGQCEAFACEEGYELSYNSTCLSIF
ncbi:uncharacterized protein I206_106231 [Kwoniella pini CBS 10737]|uniref:Protein CPL1-like domain-containing protein n=1 Tax=Kwoniella pini CBS 10737 TaxID=1296096 RepID=A0A1B9I1G3_9TREE|nr:uncharacterized protein I206_05057 [Kwoniella pini CBS 10737]OCF49364.1 hypothetical protein I206_05057 [Kwoniella pini CBS 10737]